MAEVERAIIDTNILIDNDIAPLPGILAISVISLAELQFGILVADTHQERAARMARYTFVARHFSALDIDEVVAQSYGMLAAHLKHSGRMARGRTMDLLIAATAHAHNAVLYTRNVADFLGLERYVTVREP